MGCSADLPHLRRAVLLDADGRAKVCDFGISRFKERYSDTRNSTCCTLRRPMQAAPCASLSVLMLRRTYISTRNNQAGTPAYMAPEMFEGGGLTEAVDVYSFGVLLWEIFTGALSGCPIASATCQMLVRVQNLVSCLCRVIPGAQAHPQKHATSCHTSTLYA